MLGQAHFFEEVSPLETWLSPTAWKDGSYKMPSTPFVFCFFPPSFLKEIKIVSTLWSFQSLPFCLLQTNFHLGPWPLNVTQSFLCFVYLSSSAQEGTSCSMWSWIIASGESVRASLWESIESHSLCWGNFIVIILTHYWYYSFSGNQSINLSISFSLVLKSSWTVVEQPHKTNRTGQFTIFI